MTVIDASIIEVIEAIATASLVIVTAVYVKLVYKQSKATAGMLKAQMAWRLLEEVYKPLLQDLIKLANPQNYGTKTPDFSWRKIKSEYSYLTYLIPEDLRKDLDEFSNEYEEFVERYRSTIKQLIDVLKNKECVGVPSIRVRGCYGLSYEVASLLYFIRNEEGLKELAQKCREGSVIEISTGGRTIEYKDVEAAVEAIEELVNRAKPIMDSIMPQLKRMVNRAKQMHSKVNKEAEKKIREIEKAST